MHRIPQSNNRATPQTGQSARTFTPVYDDLLKKYGPTGALIYGRIFRYCQGQSGTCYSPHKDLAEELGVDVKTVQRHAAKLVKDGLLLRERKGKGTKWTYWLPEKEQENTTTEQPESEDLKSRGEDLKSVPIKRQVKETVLASEVSGLNNNKSANSEAGSLSLLTAKLKTFGLSKRWIKSNLNQHGEGRLWEVLNALEREERDNPPGYATDALKYGWDLKPKPSRIKRRDEQLNHLEFKAAWDRDDPHFYGQPEVPTMTLTYEELVELSAVTVTDQLIQ